MIHSKDILDLYFLIYLSCRSLLSFRTIEFCRFSSEQVSWYSETHIHMYPKLIDMQIVCTVNGKIQQNIQRETKRPGAHVLSLRYTRLNSFDRSRINGKLTQAFLLARILYFLFLSLSLGWYTSSIRLLLDRAYFLFKPDSMFT